MTANGAMRCASGACRRRAALDRARRASSSCGAARAGDVATRVLGTAIDVTERREIEELLRHSNERLRLALAAGAIGSWELDAASETRRGRRQISRDLRSSRRGVDPRRRWCSTSSIPTIVEAVRRAVLAALDPHGDGRYQAEYRIRRRADGAERWVALARAGLLR